MQKHWDVMRSDDGGEHWHDIGDELPSDFGFVVDVHAHEPDTVYVLPITSDTEHYPARGPAAGVPQPHRRRRVGAAHHRAAPGALLRERAARRDGVDGLDECGVYFGTTGGQVYASADAGDSWAPIVRDLPAVLSVEVQTLPMTRAPDPGEAADAPAPAGRRGRRGAAGRAGAAHARRRAGRPGGPAPGAARHRPRPRTRQRRAFVRYFACEQDLSHQPPDALLPEPVARGREPFLVVGAMAGG